MSRWRTPALICILLGIFFFAAFHFYQTREDPSPSKARAARGSTLEKAASEELPRRPVASQALDLVPIPEGPFYAGSSKTKTALPAFWIDRTEVTNGQFEDFLKNCPLGSACGPRELPYYWEDQSYLQLRRDHPVVFVSWEDASAFCRWEGGRLPSALEWEKAARGKDGRSFPTGALDPARVNILGQDRRGEKQSALKQIPTWGVKEERYAGDVSPYRVLGMTGNVSEWTADSSNEEPDLYLAAGGSWDSWDLSDGQVHNRLPRSKKERSSSLGFRCAYSPRVFEGDVLRVAAEPDTPPMLTKKGSTYDGFDWAITNAIARHLGVSRVEIVAGKYSDLPSRVIANKADVIISGYTADDSIDGIDWSDSYFDYGLCLIVRKGSDIQSIDDLQGKVIGIFNDPAAEEDVKQLVTGYQRLEKYEDGYFDLLAEGRLDAFLYDYPYAKEEIKPYDGQLEIVQFNLTESTYNVGVRRGSRELLDMINAAIHRLKASEDYGEIVRRYLGGIEPAPIEEIMANQLIYTVQRGDTLSKIARNRLNDLARWQEIWTLNKGRIADPNLIEVGWNLVIPRS
jgi:formylglycine-generating enzyme required for sulfatase activity/ABC-type amino acid transport substrate-binding protein